MILNLLVCAVFFIIFLVVFVILLSPIYILRFILAKSVKYIRKDFGEIVASRSSIYGVDELYTRPTSTIVILGMMKERLDVENLRKRMQDLLLANKSNCVEMTEYVQPWLGFLFWRKDPNFDISNHIREYVDPEGRKFFGEAELDKLRSDLLVEPYARKRSPWEIVIVHDYQHSDGEHRDLILVKFHHVLGDGVAFTNLFFKASAETVKVLKPNYTKNIGRFANFIDTLKFIFVSPKELFLSHIFGASDQNEWHKEERLLSKEYYHTIKSGNTAEIKVADIKAIAHHFGVGFQSVILAAIAGSIRNTMQQLNVSVPKVLKHAVPIPIPGYSGGLRNHFGLVILHMPVGERNSVERLKLVHNEIEGSRGATLPFAFFLAIGLIGCLFTWLMKPLSKMQLVTICVSSFPGPVNKFSFFDNVAEEIQYSVGLLMGSVGIGFQIFTYDGKLAVGVNVDKNISSDNQVAAKLVFNFLQELRNWKKMSEDSA